MENSPLRTLAITLVALLIVAAGAYAYFTHTASAPAGSTATSTQSGVGGLPAGATVTEVPTTQPQAPVAPDYRKPVAYSAATSADVRAAVEARLPGDRALLDKNKLDFNAWLDLAVLYKIGGDYHGAEAIWLYVTKQWPTSYVAYNNLGDLYQNFLNNPAKAKLYYDQAAKLNK